MWKYNNSYPLSEAILEHAYNSYTKNADYRVAKAQQAVNQVDINMAQALIDANTKSLNSYDSLVHDANVLTRYINQYKAKMNNIITSYKKLKAEAINREQGRATMSDSSYIGLYDDIVNNQIPSANQINNKVQDAILVLSKYRIARN